MKQHEKENGGGAMSMLAGTPSLRRGGCATPLAPAQITSSLDFGVDDDRVTASPRYNEPRYSRILHY